jgi:hypothetical protein
LISNFLASTAERTTHPDVPASRTGLKASMSQALRTAYLEAFALGLHGAGIKAATGISDFRLTQPEREWVESAFRHESRYMGKFIDAIITETSTKNIFDRVDHYTETIKSIYEAGRIRGAPPDTIITWNLHPAEHCASCIFLAKHSPYLPSTLPCQPKSGQTECLYNCQCSLTYRTARPGEAVKVMAANYAISTMLRRLSDVRRRR